MKSASVAQTTLDEAEIAKFSAIAAEWWDEKGKFAPLHRINPVRLAYLRERITRHFGKDAEQIHALDGLSLVDIGCGGGLVSEPMARMGAKVTGIDGSETNIKTAQAHAHATHTKVDYRATTAEALAEAGEQFDVVLALEVIEHVGDVSLFLQSIAALVKPGGVLIVSTLNRTIKSYALAIIGAEYVLRWLPRGTHDWQKFLKPHEVILPLTQQQGLAHVETSGMVMHPLTGQWRMDDRDIDVNYYAVFAKYRV